MAKIQTYDNSVVNEAALPGARVESVATPALLGGAAEQLGAFGGGVTRAGTGIAAVASRMAERENADAVFNAETSLKADYLDYEASVREQRQGQYAKGVTKDTATWWKDNINKRVEALGNPEQQRIFTQRASGLQFNSLEGVSRFEGAETEKAHDASWKADKITTVNITAANPDPLNVDAGIAQIKNLNKYQAARKGLGADVLVAMNEADITDLHKQAIQTLVRQNPAAAQTYFEQHKDQIAGSVRAEIGEFAEKATAEAVGVRTGSEIWASLGPQADTQGAQLDKMEEEARKRLGDNTFALKATISNLRERVQAFDKGRVEREDATESAVNKAVLNGATPAQVRAMPEFLQLNPKRALAITDYMKNQAYQSTMRATAELSRANAAETREQQIMARKGMGAYLVYSDPAVLGNMSRDQIVNLLPTLGNELTQHLMQRKESIVKNPISAKFDTDSFNQVAQEVGLKPFDPHKNEDERAALGSLKFAIEQKIDSQQTILKRPMTDAEKMEMMRKEMDNKVITGGFAGFFQSEKPVISLNRKEQQTATVNVEGGHTVRLSDIPRTTDLKIRQQLQSHGQAVTEQAVAQIYADMNPKKYPKPDAYNQKVNH